MWKVGSWPLQGVKKPFANGFFSVLVMWNGPVFTWLNHCNFSKYLQWINSSWKSRCFRKRGLQFRWGCVWMAGCRAISSYGLQDPEACSHVNTPPCSSWPVCSPGMLWPSALPRLCRNVPPSSSPEHCTGRPGLPPQCTGRNTHLGMWLTPANYRGSRFTGHQIQATKRGISDLKSKLSSNLRCCHLDYAKALVCHQKSQPWMHLFTLLKGRQKAGDARQKQQHVLLPCKTEDHSSAVLSLQMN